MGSWGSSLEAKARNGGLVGQGHWWRAQQGAQGRIVKQDGAAAPCVRLCGMGFVCVV